MKTIGVPGGDYSAEVIFALEKDNGLLVEKLNMAIAAIRASSCETFTGMTAAGPASFHSDNCWRCKALKDIDRVAR